jgi:two-component system phosphate regulon sensor histidine kinase PhoR
MADILRRAMDELSPLAQEERAVVTINAPQNAWVVGDPDELIRVVENLIENAIKYGAKPGGSAHVTIDLALGDHDVELSVQDEGPGIEPEHLPRLTERFYRADAKSSRAKGGTGLGLAIVKHIVVRHSGRLVIESEPGLGTKFAVRIPKNKSGA